MRRKLFQIGAWYVRFDFTILDRLNVLLGINYIEGTYAACFDPEFTNCLKFEFAEQQIGFFFFTISIGKEIPLENDSDQTQEDAS